MILPIFKRSLDLLLDNDFTLEEDEIDQLLHLLNNDPEFIKNIDTLIEYIDLSHTTKEELRHTIKTVVEAHSDSIEHLYEKIIKNTAVISYIQQLILKRLIE